MEQFDNKKKNGVDRSRLKNTLYWLLISVLVIILLYNLYNRFLGSAPVKKMPGQQTQESVNKPEKTDELKDSDIDETTDKEEDKDTDQEVLAPDFKLKDLDGNDVKLSDYRGKIVFLNFWALWCPYCVEEMPDLNSANEKFAEDGEAIVVTVNAGDSLDKIKKFMEEKKISLPVLLDSDKSISMEYGASSIPLTYIIDKEGYLYAYIPGKTNEKTLLTIVEEIKAANENKE